MRLRSRVGHPRAVIRFAGFVPSTKRASLNCLFDDTQRIEWWPADVVCLELQNANERAFQCLSRVFL